LSKNGEFYEKGKVSNILQNKIEAEKSLFLLTDWTNFEAIHIFGVMRLNAKRPLIPENRPWLGMPANSMYPAVVISLP
jgi:hypothetical protein